MKFFTKLQVSIEFSRSIFWNSLASGLRQSNPLQIFDYIFLDYWRKDREICDKFLKNLKKIGKMSIRTIQ